MGAVINATFGSIIEIILYSIALTQSKGRLVEGSIVGSLLAGVLLMPGMSMCSGALRRKDLKFNAKSASVTSMMLIMAIIGALTPTLFYQTYGNVCLYPFFFALIVTHEVYSSSSFVRDVLRCLENLKMLPGSVTTVIIRTQILQTIHSISRR